MCLCLFTSDGGPRVSILHRLVEEPGGDDGAVSFVTFNRPHQQLLTPLFQQFGSSNGHRGLCKISSNIQIFAAVMRCASIQ